MDYSYEITPLSQLHNANTSNFKPHIPQPNWGMPAYVAGRLAWGSPPVAVCISCARTHKHQCSVGMLHHTMFSTPGKLPCLKLTKAETSRLKLRQANGAMNSSMFGLLIACS